MNVKTFLDTNIFVYCLDHSAKQKRGLSLALVESALQTGNGIISTQVIKEFLSVSTKKFVKTFQKNDLEDYLTQVLLPLCDVYPSPELFKKAIHLQSSLRYSFYDSLILATAIESGCKTLFTEDMQHGQKIETLTIQNPFL